MEQKRNRGVSRLTVTRVTRAEENDTPQKEERTPQSKSLKTAKRALFCTCLVCAAAMIRMIDTPFTNAVGDGIKTALTFDVSVEDTLGRLKFVQNRVENAVTVFSAGDVGQKEADAARFAENGTVKAAFDERTHPYLEIAAKENATVYSPRAGRVTAAETANGQTNIAVEYDDKLAALFCGLASSAVKEGDAVSAGGAIGVCAKEGTICVYLYRDGAPIDPMTIADGR